MRLRRLAMIGAATAAVAAVASGWALSAGASGNSGAAPVPSTITLINSDPPATFAPPPADAAPALTAQQAADAYVAALGHSPVDIPSGVTVSLGLVTIPVAPDCGPECENGNIVSNGMVYSALNQLAYSYAITTCPPGSGLPADQCTKRLLLDANTGELIVDIGPALSRTPDQSPSPSPSALG
jgi:hypothetical protein